MVARDNAGTQVGVGHGGCEMSEAIRKVQEALARQGFSPGAIDGIWGRQTLRAVRAFQAKAGLAVDGVVGPATTAALFAPPAGGPPGVQPPPPPIVWFEEARRLMGMREGEGALDNPTILNWAGDLGITYTHDDIPWCGLFVSHCIGATLPDEPLPAGPLGARNWQAFGRPAEPGLGAVMVFWRESVQGFKGHVGFYIGEDAQAFHILGGNQSDSVCVARVRRDRLLQARWPATADSLPAVQVQLAAGGTLSTHEA
jgi:uncharacterized protein (TIGR02594 family)